MTIAKRKFSVNCQCLDSDWSCAARGYDWVDLKDGLEGQPFRVSIDNLRDCTGEFHDERLIKFEQIFTGELKRVSVCPNDDVNFRLEDYVHTDTNFDI